VFGAILLSLFWFAFLIKNWVHVQVAGKKGKLRENKGKKGKKSAKKVGDWEITVKKLRVCCCLLSLFCLLFLV
jgi:hypothetical protein